MLVSIPFPELDSLEFIEIITHSNKCRMRVGCQVMVVVTYVFYVLF